MSNLIDETGKRFGRLVVIDRAPNRNGFTMWRCACDCGGEKIANASSLRSGNLLSCGCLWGNHLAVRTYKHGWANTQLYKTYYAMLSRCYKVKHPSFHDYGARGITVCQEWLKNKVSFFEWSVSSGYKPNLSIDRKDNNGNYSPENCRWVDMLVQGSNKRSNRLITINGDTKTLAQWSRHFSTWELSWRRQRPHKTDRSMTAQMGAVGSQLERRVRPGADGA